VGAGRDDGEKLKAPCVNPPGSDQPGEFLSARRITRLPEYGRKSRFESWRELWGHELDRLEGPVYSPVMETVIIEIRAAEGGEDAKLLVQDLLGIYVKAGGRRCL